MSTNVNCLKMFLPQKEALSLTENKDALKLNSKGPK